LKKIVMNTIKPFLFLGIMLAVAACMTAGKGMETKGGVHKKAPLKETKTTKSEARSRYKAAEAYIEAKRADNSVYWGEGIANIEGDIGECKIEARKRAIGDLSGQIKTQVSSDFKRVIRTNATTSGGVLSEDVEKSIEAKLETYTSQVLTNLKESRLYIDYPEKGTGTYIVFISKKEYNEKVKKDMNQKKQLVTDTIRSGDRAFVNKQFLEGINQYIQARQMKQSFFGMIPVYQDIDGNGSQEEFIISIDERIRTFFSGLKLSLLNNGFQYDSQGAPETLPRVYVRFRDVSGTENPVSGLPLRTVFATGEGAVSTAVTGDYGEVELAVTRINPKHRETLIRVDIDRNKIMGLEAVSTGREQSLAVRLKRQKTIALSVSFSNYNKKSVPSKLKDSVTGILLDKKYSVVHLPVLSEQAIKNSTDINADYVFLIRANTSGGGAVGQYANMFTANCGASLKVFKMPLKNLSLSESVKTVQGFGVSKENAGWDGFGKIRGKIEKKAKAMIERIK